MGWEPSAEEWLDHDTVYFECGSRAELDRLVRLALLCEPAECIADGASSRQSVWIATAYKKRAHVLTERVSFYNSDRLRALVEVFLKHHHPTGFCVGHDDESKYWKQEATIYYPVEEVATASARERMHARRELAEWLTEHGYEPETYGLAAIPVSGSKPTDKPDADCINALPLFSGIQPERAIPPTVFHACGRFVRIPFALIIEHRLAEKAEAEEASMSQVPVQDSGWSCRPLGSQAHVGGRACCLL